MTETSRVAVTMKDVAKVAGVSVATVSRVLGDRDGVGEATRKAVRDACRRLGYQPDALASALRTGSSSSIGIVVPDITNPYFPAVLQTVEHELARVAIDLVFCDADNDVQVEARRLETLMRRRVDALLVCPVDVEGSAAALRAVARRVRLLQLDRHALEEADYLGIDEAAGMSQIVQHIENCGATSAVFVGSHLGISSIAERARAFEAACRASNIQTFPPIRLPHPDVNAGRAAAAGLIAEHKRPSAIVCSNDQVAFGVLAELRDAGLQPGHDILVTGYDDVPAAELVGLTTVRQPLEELGREAVRLLQQASNVPRQVRLAPSLIPRSTTVKPNVEDTPESTT